MERLQRPGGQVQGVLPVMDRSRSRMNFTSGSWGTLGPRRFTTPGPAWILAWQLESSFTVRSQAQLRKRSSGSSASRMGAV